MSTIAGSQAMAVSSLSRARTLDRILRWLRTCGVCGSMRPPIELLCGRCRDRLDTFANRDEALWQPDYPFRVRALYTWTPASAGLVRPTLHAFKGGRAASAARLWAEALSLGAEGGPVRFVHPPASTGRRDHAWLLAWSLAELWGGTAPLALAPVAGRSSRGQKRRSIAERSERRFAQVDLEKNSAPETRWIFVDDVITSGSTAMAAYMALGDPMCYEVWVLACRPKLAGKTSF